MSNRFRATAACAVASATLASFAHSQVITQVVDVGGSPLSQTPAAGGQFAKLVGTGFPAVVTGVQVGNNFSPRIISSSATQIEFVMPAGTGTAKTIQAFFSGGVSSNQVLIDYQGPSLREIAPLSGPTAGGGTITVSGTNFGSNPSVTFGGAGVIVTFQSDSVIQFQLPPGSGKGIELKVTSGGQSVTTHEFSYSPPFVSSVAGNGGSTSGGHSITIMGTGFMSGATQVTIGGNPCTLGSVTPSSISCLTPPGVGLNLPVAVTVGGQPASGTATYSYGAPSVSGSPVPSLVGTAGGQQVTVTGQNFATVAQVLVGGIAATNVIAAHTTLKFDAPAGQGLGQPVVIQTASGSTQTSIGYLAPLIVTAPNHAIPGSIIQIDGQNFGQTPAVLFGGLAASVVSKSSTRLHVVVPNPTSASASITVFAANQLSNARLFDFDCIADLDGNLLVDDADFVLFATAYDQLVCY
ncbi:MAG: IPT/TIG domain-containing protein [Phycisphaeraceae bacterium]|nr:IPT/TIG domain-containing protein [Phycisphaeraceae bacterium]